MASPRLAAYCPSDGRLLREATAAEVAAYEDANRQRAELAPARKATCFNEGVRVGEVRIDIDTGPGVWFGGAGF